MEQDGGVDAGRQSNDVASRMLWYEGGNVEHTVAHGSPRVAHEPVPVDLAQSVDGEVVAGIHPDARAGAIPGHEQP